LFFTLLLYILAAGFFAWSYLRDRKKTQLALQKALKSFLGIMPDFAAVLALVGIMMTYLSPALVARFIGPASGLVGMLITALVGAITLIPGFVAFPLAASLLARGAGISQIAVFISTLMMVGVVTAPLEAKYFGRRETILRNSLGFLYSFVVAALMGVILR